MCFLQAENEVMMANAQVPCTATLPTTDPCVPKNCLDDCVDKYGIISFIKSQCINADTVCKCTYKPPCK